MSKISKFFFICICSFPSWSFAEINTVYDAKLKAQQVKDAVANSPVYGIAMYSTGAIFAFIVAILVVFLLIMLIKR